MITQLKEHWEKIYSTKQANEVSWTQDVPATSLGFVHGFKLPKSASIIDIGGGDSKLVDCLLEKGYENITVLDISSAALEKAKLRLGTKAEKVKWIVADINQFTPIETYDIWHDRAAFHFLTTEAEIEKYLSIATQAISNNGYLVIGTFSENGPIKCSGLPIKQYSEKTLLQTFGKGFEKLKCITEDHTTPFNTSQNFAFCSFKKRNIA